MRPVAGLLLTGGAASRLKTDKPLVELNGETLAAGSARRLAGVCRPVFELGPGCSGLPFLPDEQPFAGPLAALAGAAARLDDTVLQNGAIVLATDMPLVPGALLKALARASPEVTLVPRLDGQVQPLCARYSISAFQKAQQLHAQGGRSMKQLLTSLEVEWLEGDALQRVAGLDAFTDIDTPQDLLYVRAASPER